MLRTVLLPFLVCGGVAAAAPATLEKLDQELATGRQTITTIEERIREQEVARRESDVARARLETELKRLDGELSEHNAAVASLDREIAKLSGDVAALQQERDNASHSVAAKRGLLAERLRQLYGDGGNRRLSMLLGASDAADLIYRQRYDEAMAAAMGRVIDDLQREGARLAEVQRELHARQLQLAVEKQAATASRKAVAVKRREQQALVARAEERGKTLDAQLTTLAVDRERLTSMVSGLTAKRQAALSRLHFGDQRGRLPWPIEGEVVEFFGAPSEDGSPGSNNGIRIRAHTGEKVQAIWEGEVLFADWFEGYGLLIIIDHGSGYYSLYGHASGLLASVGDHLQQGQAVAEIGGELGHEAGSLYFEMRKDGKPINPLHWLQGLAGRTTAAAAE
ncbi:MAG: peptidoglycan DD-metalloendopeptidase family protein [Nitrospirota bacterium]